ncbi:MAG: gliding motility lipoprotein GldD [Bacteroidetes bacterium RIFOXYA12_FULL_35_11]|nr:MAG: gliding motility lipoprotein GldD [Bacteroidetes bacterium GWF2_35_48]OFY76609.1 MAG: gliding motility lipoprotein GldD [Bacteroidetes bacterium RIFOXYA12_FULL_35_11]OFY96592.1 MAG: gliding motility lipoprotein GldD [Bacteroidetes bacterium RIFOXYC12_FULL_35_7]HBX53635.1 gliding motility lipoprotein GldD [Bacteroidales bacterium]
MKKISNYTLLYVFVILIICVSCESEFTPKPTGYMRVDFPEKKYKIYSDDCPFSFEYPVYAEVISDNSKNAEPCWLNINFPKFNGKIYISYKKINKNIAKFIGEARDMVNKHTIKADAINDHVFSYKEKKVYGIFYDIKGNAASSKQFFITDSVNHFIRGALYFNSEPNKDSLGPVINYIHQDIERMIETFEWK